MTTDRMHEIAIMAAERRLKEAADHVDDTLAAYAAAEDAYTVAYNALDRLRRNAR